jgi:prepilin-type N-terminal cleavage/methylation domain-containing protein
MLLRRGSLADDRGFTLVEVLVAMFLLLVGVLGVVSLLEGANAATNAADTRIGATNLAREIVEDAHGADYDSLLTSTVVPALRQNAAIAGALSGSTWTITRRGEQYTTTVTACKYDDPKDGVASVHDGTYCSNSLTAATNPPDSNGDDFRRVDVTISWNSQGGRPHTLKQSAVIVNPSGGLGPRITSMTPLKMLVQPAGPTACASPDCAQVTSGDPAFSVTTATAATSLHWSASDGSSGTLTPPSPTKSFNLTWSVSSLAVLDGTYTLNVQAFDDRGVPGDLSTATVIINNNPPAQPTGFRGGWDSWLGIVDLRWSPNPEGDIVGYHVYRGGALVCDVPATQSYCSDLTPPDPSAEPNPTYSLVAVDLQDAAGSNASSNQRESTAAGFTLADPTDAPPTFASGGGTLSYEIKDNLPTIKWTEPATDSDGQVRFYRIYRDPASAGSPQYSDRYDFTTGAATTYSDPHPGGTLSHVYWVTAVDDKFQESTPIGPFQP